MISRFEFVIDVLQLQQTGSYWYHSHLRGQYPDGLRGPLIIHDPDDPFKDQYDEEVALTVSDWYHDQMATLLPQSVSRFNPIGAKPSPDSAIWNDTTNVQVAMEPGKTYLFRLINVGAFVGCCVWFDQHSMRIVEVDGVYHEPAEADMIYIAAAQRYAVLVTVKN
jgi:iron transport multicopper oxidase